MVAGALLKVLTIARRAISVTLSAMLGAVAGSIAFFGTALFTASVTVLVVVGALVLLTVSGGLAYLSGRGGRRPLLLSCGVASATLVVVALSAALTVFKPLGFEPAPYGSVDGGRYWDLPTDSRVAYEFFPAAGAGETPVIMLHGGPGAPATEVAKEHMARAVTGAGFDLYYYDQLGTGRSTRLEDVRGYTVERQVRDLEAVRRETGAEEIILIGGSWGAELGAHYMATHPERVKKAVLFSPGALYWPDVPAPEDEPAAAEGDSTVGHPPRLLAWYGLFFVNPEAAHNFAPDREMDGYLDAALSNRGLSSAVCDPESLESSVKRGGSGWYVSNMTGGTHDNYRDPRPALRRTDTPILIMRGECETVPWAVAREYREVLPDSTLVNVPGAGHLISVERPGLFGETIGALLLGEPLPLEPYKGDEPPRFGSEARVSAHNPGLPSRPADRPLSGPGRDAPAESAGLGRLDGVEVAQETANGRSQ